MSGREGRIKVLLAVVVVPLLAAELGAQWKPAPQVKENLGRLHHPITTSSPEAQRLFDEGLTLVYAFNHEEAIRRFERAAEGNSARGARDGAIRSGMHGIETTLS